MLSTREVATLIWLGVLIIFILSKKDVRKSLFGVFKAFLKLVFNVVGGYILLYLGSIIVISYCYNILDFDFIKGYIVWIFFGLFPLLDKTISKNYTDLKALFLDVVKFSIIPIYIVNEYTFALAVEIILLPAILLITMLVAVAELDEKNAPVKKFLDSLLAIIGLLIGFFAFRAFINNYRDAIEVSFWMNMFFDVLLVFAHIPLLILVRIAVAYQEVMLRTKFKNMIIKKIATFIVFYHCNINTLKLLLLKKELRFGRFYTLKEFNTEIKRILYQKAL